MFFLKLTDNTFIPEPRKACGCRDDDHDACPQCEGWSQAELDRQDARRADRERELAEQTA